MTTKELLALAKKSTVTDDMLDDLDKRLKESREESLRIDESVKSASSVDFMNAPFGSKP